MGACRYAARQAVQRSQVGLPEEKGRIPMSCLSRAKQIGQSLIVVGALAAVPLTTAPTAAFAKGTRCRSGDRPGHPRRCDRRRCHRLVAPCGLLRPTAGVLLSAARLLPAIAAVLRDATLLRSDLVRIRAVQLSVGSRGRLSGEFGRCRDDRVVTYSSLFDIPLGHRRETRICLIISIGSAPGRRLLRPPRARRSAIRHCG